MFHCGCGFEAHDWQTATVFGRHVPYYLLHQSSLVMMYNYTVTYLACITTVFIMRSWNFSNPDTNVAEESVHISEVSLLASFQGCP